ncbi:MAG TPA: helix-turn-helix transcriptional regulator, partial [Anaerolineales bacterium]|nr:helix-turn-helix transcriptional regulator [Anaerolineales bacterium]
MTTIGQRLKEAREDRRLTLEKVFEATRIRVQYLQALEADDLSVMPSPVQARGYLRNYAEYLDLDVLKILDELREANAQEPSQIVLGPSDLVDSQPVPPANTNPVAEIASGENISPLIKQKPARRKKPESQLEGDLVPTPKRRRRKRSDQELEAAIPVEPANVRLSEKEPDDNASLPSAAETPPSEEEKLSQRERIDSEATSESNAELLVNGPSQTPELPPLEKPQSDADVSDKLWQTWRNRLSSVLAARNKRPTLVPNKDVIAEIESKPTLPETETRPELLPVEDLPAEGSAKIFKEIGEELRKRRELLSLHMEEVERNTH